jgi:hypothetical protein
MSYGRLQHLVTFYSQGGGAQMGKRHGEAGRFLKTREASGSKPLIGNELWTQGPGVVIPRRFLSGVIRINKAELWSLIIRY